MTDDLANQAVSYLCGDLDRGHEAEFEELLERDPVAVAALKACADGMARYALAEAGELPFDPRERAEMAALIVEASGAGRERLASRLRWLWPIAAAFLLALNLWQWAIRPGVFRQQQTAGSAGASGRSLAGTEEGGAAAVRRTKPATPPPHPREINAEVAKAMARLAALHQEYGRLQISKNELNVEYARTLQQLAAQEIMAQGTSRVVAMELVDSASYANGGRPGLFDLSTAQLTKPGVVAAGPATNANSANSAPAANAPLQGAVSSVGPSVATAPTASTTPPSEVASNQTGGNGSAETAGVTLQSLGDSTTPVTVNNTTTGTAVAGPPASSGTASPTTSTPAPSSAPTASPGSSTSGNSAPTASTPYAVSLFDEAQEQGYMDLYNLPTITADQTLQLWVLPAGSDNFQNVGQVPAEYSGGSGSIYYKLPDGTATPAQILITVEPRSSTLAAPTGAVVLRGP